MYFLSDHVLNSSDRELLVKLAVNSLIFAEWLFESLKLTSAFTHGFKVALYVTK